MNEMDEIKAIFIEEAQDIIQRVFDDLDGFLQDENRLDRFNSILRGIHTIKGGAASCDFMDIKTEAHELETELQGYKDKCDEVQQPLLDKIRNALEHFEQILKPSQAVTAGPAPESTQQVVDVQTAAPAQKSAEASKSKAPAATEVIRVTVDRIQKNFDFIGEIFLTRNQLRHLAEQRMLNNISDEQFFRNWEVLDGRLRQSIRDLEQNAMDMRLMSVKSLLRRMQSTVKSFATSARKDIDVELIGEDTEIDKLIVDSLGEPLIHLVRNAMDHGIEETEERRAKNKKASALIKISVAVQGSEAVIQVGDDGRGIDPQKVYESAKRKGLDVSRAKTRDDMLNLIFMPGFSTKEAVSETSGRGVGMDAVKTYVDDLGGSISIQTETNVGTTFTMRLPLGLSVVPAIVATINGCQVAVATADVTEIFKAPRENIAKNDNERFYNLRGRFIPCINLKDYLFIPSEHTIRVDQHDVVPICIIETGFGPVAMEFESLQSNVELALKAVPQGAAKLPYITGVSTLATGNAVFVLSMSKLYDHIRQQTRQQFSQKQEAVHVAS